MTVAIVDYGSGNLRSAQKAFERAAADIGYGGGILVTADAETVRRADRVVLPGVGAFADCRRGLTAVPGMVEALTDAVIRRAVPFLGICVGMQLMAERGREYGVHPGLGWIKGEVVALTPADPGLKVPHMGWNELQIRRPDHPVLRGLAPGSHAYFVHSFCIDGVDPADVLVTVDYGGPVNAVIGRDNLIGTQFHPEKSQAAGLALIARFLEWRP
ncbi:MAG: imidazole glycerol phosphate synthase subunit HisH [Azospirillaceae bacterium]|nr:imidazole glycerol phosphate synthase subunit HisH [Azospirillaceae bacterium]